jgi:RecG-like helicase
MPPSNSVKTNMKINTLLAGVAGGLLLAMATATPALAEGKDVTVQGEAKCAKCSLHEADKCQTVIQTKEDGKTVTYWVAQNDIAKGFHKEVCTDSKKVKATGKVETVDGKKQLTLTKITPET